MAFIRPCSLGCLRYIYWNTVRVCQLELTTFAISITIALAALVGILTTTSTADDSIFLVKKRIENSDSCQLIFPAIRRDTLFTQNPQLQDPKHGELINFYGPCDHDPLGEQEIKAQRREVARKFFSLIILGAASGKK